MKQRRNLYGLLIGAMCLMACSNETETIDGNPDDIRLSFQVEEAVKTRGTAYTAAKFTGDLYLLAVKDETKAAAAKYDDVSGVHEITSTTANYNTKKRWPDHGLYFYAFYPETWATTFTFSGANPTYTVTNSSSKYTISSTFADQEDLLFAYSGLVNKLDEVDLTFNHILSRITFEVKTDGFVGGETVTLKTLKLENIHTTATPTFKGSAFTWTVDATPKADFTAFSGTEVIGTTFESIPASATNNSLFMFPRTNTEFDTNAKLTITYRLSSEASDRTFSVNLKDLKESDTTTPHLWAMGKWTNYQITIKANYILIKPITVNGWGSKNNVDVPVTY